MTLSFFTRFLTPSKTTRQPETVSAEVRSAAAFQRQKDIAASGKSGVCKRAQRTVYEATHAGLRKAVFGE
jgi:hypothetical protein